MLRLLPVAALALIALATPASALTVRMEGTAAGGDTLTITGNDSQDRLIIREGFEGDIGPGGQQRDCVSESQLCFLTVEATSAITAQGACQPDGANTLKVRCAYFSPGQVSSAHAYAADIRLGDGANDSVRITQATAFAPGQVQRAIPWSWTIDYGPGNDVIDGPLVLSVPDVVGTVGLTIMGGPGSDLFTGLFPTRPTVLFGDDNRDVVNVPDGTDIYRDVTGGFGMKLAAEGNDDQIDLGDGSQLVEAGAGNDVVLLSGAVDGEAETVDGGPGTDGVNYGTVAPPLTVHLDGSQPSTGSDTLRNFENVTGSPFGDRIFGTDAPNKLTGNGGRGDALIGRGGNDTLNVDDGTTGPPGPSADDSADGGAGEDLILSNDGVRDLVSCGTSSHIQTVFINNQPTQLTIFDSDRARLDLTDTERDCEDVQREAVRTPPAAKILRAKAAGSQVRLVLHCARGVRGGCRGRASVSAGGASGARVAGKRYRIRAGRRGSVGMSLPARPRARLRRRGVAFLRVTVVEKDSKGRSRTRSRVLLVR